MRSRPITVDDSTPVGGNRHYTVSVAWMLAVVVGVGRDSGSTLV